MKVFSGSSNLKLAKKLAKELKCELGRMELGLFSNSETKVWIKDKKFPKTAIVVQSFSPDPNSAIIEFCFICDALYRSNVNKIIGVIPWLGYCIQDKVFRSGEPLSSKVIAKIINNSRVNKIITLDLHNETTAGFFDKQLIHLSAGDLFIDYFKKESEQFDIVISPDVGGLKRATKFALSLDLPIVTVNKKRDLATGKTLFLGISSKVKGKSVMIVDDFVSTGQTLIQTADYLKKSGVKNIFSCLTHHFYIPGVQEKIDHSKLDMVYVTDTIQEPKNKNYKKLKIISVAGLIADSL